MQRRNKVGGLIDRRFAEDDPNVSLEEKMIERYTREQLRHHKKSSMFDLEGGDEPMGGLTHDGKPLFDDDDEGPLKDDFDEEDLPSGDESDSSRAEKRALKRQRLTEVLEGQEDEDGQPDRKKTKKEIYEEIIAKSKLHKMVGFPVFIITPRTLTLYRNVKMPKMRIASSGPNSTRLCLNSKPCFSGNSHHHGLQRALKPPWSSLERIKRSLIRITTFD
jgi:hypothetical protein